MAAARVSTQETDSGLELDLQLSPLVSQNLRRPLREREQLRLLNDRLAAYIQRVRALESAKAALHLRLGRCEEDSSRDLNALRGSYDRELGKARRALEQRALQEAALQAAADSLREQHQQLLARSVRRRGERFPTAGVPTAKRVPGEVKRLKVGARLLTPTRPGSDTHKRGWGWGVGRERMEGSRVHTTC